MRLVQLVLPTEDPERVLGVLDDHGVDYVRLPAEDTTLVQFPLPAQAVEPVLSDLRDAGLGDEYVVVTSAESAVTERFDELEARYVEGSEADESIEPRELAAKARDLTPNAATYYSMTLLSAVVALAGLLLDSPAIVVGSMVIAPQVGSALTAAVGVVHADRGMIRAGLRAQVVGLLAAIAGAAAVGWVVQAAAFVPAPLDVTTVNQISQRISPGVLSLLVGLAAGAAGSLGLATALPVSLVGVMIAAALIPAAAAVGVGIAFGLPVVTVGAALLLASNFAAINVVAPGVLWTLGYRPPNWSEVPLRRFAHVVAIVLVLVAVFAGTTALTANQMAFERDANRAVADTLDAPEYEGVTLVGVRATVPVVGSDYGVTVVVERPADESYDGLADRIQANLADRTGRSVPVEVQFVDRVRSSPDSYAVNAPWYQYARLAAR